MLVNTGIENNFRFMVLEVTKQVELTLAILQKPSQRLIKRLVACDDYIDNLKTTIENKCFSTLGSSIISKPTVDMLRALHIIANNLERIADFSVNIVAQFEHLLDPTFLQHYDYAAFFQEVFEGLELVDEALFTRDINQAITICRSEANLDKLYRTHFDRVLNELRTGKNVEDQLSSLLILHYLERMGDSLQNIGEAIIFAVLGEKFKFHQYDSLKTTLSNAGIEPPITEVEFESIWGTRSGCRIGKVRERARAQVHDALYKEGDTEKLLQEKNNIERWEQIAPGLPPRVLEFRQGATDSALLVEYLNGVTLQAILFNVNNDQVNQALGLVGDTLEKVWSSTKKDQKINARYVHQMLARLRDVFKVHPHFRTSERWIGDLRTPGLEELLQLAENVEKELDAPFSVFIHGDFNLDNILCDLRQQQVHFIDLHRSGDFDYVQDISVFIVSGLRMPVFEPRLRERIYAVGQTLMDFGRGFATRHGDHCYDVRLALGLARSFFTSSRFELDEEFATSLFLRAVFLLEHVLAHQPSPWATFRLDRDLLRL